MPIIPNDVVIQLEAPNRWVATNVFAKTCVGFDKSLLNLFSDLGTLTDTEIISIANEQHFKLWDIGCFSNYQGLLADPTRRIRAYSEWPQPLNLNASQALDKLRDNAIIIDNETEYRTRFAPKETLIDTHHFGNFHQQLGQELFVNRRELAETWWLNQKFTNDYSDIQSNLYKAVQEYYLKTYLPKRFQQHAQVIDLGCGIGYYTKLMATSGAQVLGIDPNSKFIQIAQKTTTQDVRFEVAEIGTQGALDHIPSNSVDFVFMSDALLFYFTPEKPTQKANIQFLLSDIHRILKPNGTYISLEPHYLFWLQPWFGSPNYPFTILTEYSDKTFGVTPTISKLIQAWTENSFAISWMDELKPDPTFEQTDSRAYHFAAQFPLWQLFELKAV